MSFYTNVMKYQGSKTLLTTSSSFYCAVTPWITYIKEKDALVIINAPTIHYARDITLDYYFNYTTIKLVLKKIEGVIRLCIPADYLPIERDCFKYLKELHLSHVGHCTEITYILDGCHNFKDDDPNSVFLRIVCQDKIDMEKLYAANLEYEVDLIHNDDQFIKLYVDLFHDYHYEEMEYRQCFDNICYNRPYDMWRLIEYIAKNTVVDEEEEDKRENIHDFVSCYYITLLYYVNTDDFLDKLKNIDYHLAVKTAISITGKLIPHALRFNLSRCELLCAFKSNKHYVLNNADKSTLCTIIEWLDDMEDIIKIIDTRSLLEEFTKPYPQFLFADIYKHYKIAPYKIDILFNRDLFLDDEIYYTILLKWADVIVPEVIFEKCKDYISSNMHNIKKSVDRSSLGGSESILRYFEKLRNNEDVYIQLAKYLSQYKVMLMIKYKHSTSNEDRELYEYILSFSSIV